MKLTEKKQKEYNKFMNEQFEILKIHFSRTMLRCINKFYELENERQTRK